MTSLHPQSRIFTLYAAPLVIKSRTPDGDVNYIRIDPGCTDPRFVNDLVAGRFDDVITSADRILETRPEDRDALFYKAEAHYMLGQYEECIGAYDAIIAMEVSNDEQKIMKATALNNKAVTLCKSGDCSQTFELFKEAAKLNPDSGIIAGNLADAYAVEGDYESALHYAERALSLGGPDEEYRLYLEALKIAMEIKTGRRPRPAACAEPAECQL